jgi:hypothetical protein
MLDEIGVAHTFLFGRLYQKPDRFPLVVAGKDQSFLDLLLALGFVFLFFYGEEIPQNIEPVVSLPDLLPEVGSGIAVRVRRIPRPLVVALVEGKKTGMSPFKPGRNKDLICGDGKVNQCPCLEGQQRFILFGDRIPWKAVFLILSDGIPDVLGQVGLEFAGGHRKTVHEKSQVKRVLVIPGIMELTDNGQSVGRIVGPEVRIRIVGRSELAERESGITVLEAMPQKKEGSVPVELFDDSF